MIVFIYSVIGVQLFAKVKNGVILNENINFRDFGSALLTVIRIATGEHWNDLMYDCLTKEDCEPDPEYNHDWCIHNSGDGCVPLNGCGSNYAYMYYFIYLDIFIHLLLYLDSH